jgi:hypothetical protein
MRESAALSSGPKNAGLFFEPRWLRLLTNMTGIRSKMLQYGFARFRAKRRRTWSAVVL